MFRRLATIGLALLGFELSAHAQGPVVLLGIDAEDFNISSGGHGGTDPYVQLIQVGLLNKLSNGWTKALVVGAGKDPNDDVTLFWTKVLDDVGVPYEFVNGKQNILRQGFRGHGIICIANALPQTPYGGLTNEENNALTLRAPEIASFVNGGGGVLGTAQAGLSNPYGYLGPDFFQYNFPAQFQTITPTPAGLSLGITNVFDTCCWHDEYINFPSYFTVLATNDDTGNPCAIGGDQVVLVRRIVGTPLFSQCFPGETHDFDAFVSKSTVPQPGVTVHFDIPMGPNAGTSGMGVTAANGQVSFSYTSNGAIGRDRIRLYFFENGEPVLDVIHKDWLDPAECFLVVGPGPGNQPWTSGHTWQTQLSTVTNVFPVTLTNIPSFVLPAQPPRKKAQLNATKVAEFSVQMLLWNPPQFPTNPEQYTQGMSVTMWSNGRVTARRYGNEDSMEIFMETYTDPDDGLRYVRFPFTIEGF
jgi:hypothetical protein